MLSITAEKGSLYRVVTSYYEPYMDRWLMTNEILLCVCPWNDEACCALFMSAKGVEQIFSSEIELL